MQLVIESPTQTRKFATTAEAKIAFPAIPIYSLQAVAGFGGIYMYSVYKITRTQ